MPTTNQALTNPSVADQQTRTLSGTGNLIVTRIACLGCLGIGLVLSSGCATVPQQQLWSSSITPYGLELSEQKATPQSTAKKIFAKGYGTSDVSEVSIQVTDPRNRYNRLSVVAAHDTQQHTPESSLLQVAASLELTEESDHQPVVAYALAPILEETDESLVK